ncbi:hypothetical protein AAFN60_14645 [Roseibacillus persicicus]|uniref:hypothetical protein n=1 Tax=Roseibacillus persicicus TaxID=454148 RepID=UPI00398A8780
MMVLLSLIAVGLLSIGATSVRSSQAGEAQLQARANARLALALAIGQLQKLAGSDTRVTASAELLDETNPPALGVWKSWEGSDHQSSGALAGRPIPPDYSSKKRAVNSSNGRFLGWLVSGAEDTTDPSEVDGLLSQTQRKNSVPLLAKGSLGTNDPRQVHVEPSILNRGEGALAWWVSGENQKAHLPNIHEPEQGTPAEWSVMMRTHATADPESLGLEQLLDNPEAADKVISRASSHFLAGESSNKKPPQTFHDFTTSSEGLLTNVATGGWRKDLSLFTEKWDSLPRDTLPVFRLSPDRTILMDRPMARSPQAKSSIFFPWADYRAGTGSAPIYQHGAAASWHHLKEWATFYKDVRSATSGVATVSSQASDIANAATSFQFLHQVRTSPVVARIHWVFSHRTAVSADGPSSSGELELQLLVNPVVTLWNPYNVGLRVSPLRLSLQRNLPCSFSYRVARADRRYRSLLSGSESQGFQPLSSQTSLNYRITRPVILAPGETRVFSAGGNVPVGVDRSSSLDLSPGYMPGGGHLFVVKDASGNPAKVRATDLVRVDVKFDTAYDDISEGVGIYLDMGPASSNERYLVYRMVYTREMANQVYPPITSSELTQPSAGEILNNPVPFLSTVFGTRLASESHLPARGFLQSSPLVNYTAMGSKASIEDSIGHEYPGVLHPVNSPFDYSFIKHAPGDSRLPNSGEENHSGYIVSGFDKSSGLSRVVAAELPIRPICSLAELQNWDLRYENPIPPYQFNVIANSDATPLIPPNAVVNPGAPSNSKNLQHDDAYCANHLLFDDWFVSSISDRPDTFGRGGESLSDVFADFVAGETPLDNRSYHLFPEDQNDQSGELLEEIEESDSWQTIAARLQVEGMFNVNSVSLPAWKALLKHARDQSVPYLSFNGQETSVLLSDQGDHAISRFPIAGDVEAGQPGTSGAFFESSEFTGYRRFSDQMLDQLAENLVAQIRARGPFLSLSEFINRQLSSGELALAGALQTALNQLGKGSSGPYGTLAALSRDAGGGDLAELAKASYAFPEAAVGESAFGLPGWTRQADILRPLAPILTARDDTFTIRAYGDSRDASGKIVATATCEAVVRRSRDFVAASKDAANITHAPLAEENQHFGRRFEVVQFRWLKPDEV